MNYGAMRRRIDQEVDRRGGVDGIFLTPHQEAMVQVVAVQYGLDVTELRSETVAVARQYTGEAKDDIAARVAQLRDCNVADVLAECDAVAARADDLVGRKGTR